MSKPWGIFRSLFALAPVLVLVPFVSYKMHYCESRSLRCCGSNSPQSPADPRDITVSPTPPVSGSGALIPFSPLYRTDPVTGLPQISESKILSYAKYLSEDIGYRTVGTKEHALGDAWLLKQAQLIAEQCPKNLECEVWRQSGSGSHRHVIILHVILTGD